MDKEKAKVEIKKLIDDFKSNYQKYKKELEANTETKLIEPLFQILGWTKNDFVKREKAHRGIRSGFADYAFYIGDKIVFFLEAKKVGISLDKEAYKQVISYALSKRVPFAVATNFEQLTIFCVEQQDALSNKFRVFNEPDDYVNNFEDLMFLSKESFEHGLTLKKAGDEGRLKKRVSIDKALLEDLMLIRKLISDDLEKTYPEKYQINEKDEIIQRIVDRLIFIRRCEDVGISPENMLIEDIRRLPDNKAYPKLKEIFHRYNEIYNSGLFALAKDNDCDQVDINGVIIKKLAYNLYESKDHTYIYNFDWIDADILGQVYEQYLGIILEQTKSGRAKLKNSQAHKKEQGIYYTPTWVVEYIVKNTIGEILKDKKIKPENIKVLDPACGSGSFLIKAFDYLYNHISGTEESKQHRIDSQGNYSAKTEILKNNIYGVDLDNKAVEITKLNLLLKAAEKYRKLPEEIDLHIKHGNSLISDENIEGLDAFKWLGDFKEGSFDAIIGNPPYVKLQNLNKNQIEYFYSHYKSATKHYDIYVLFVEKALSLLREGGVLGFILPSKFFNADYGEGLRKVISENKSLNKLVNFKDFQVFDNATTYTCLLFLKKSKNKNFEYLELNNKNELNTSSRVFMKLQYKKSTLEQPSQENWSFATGDNTDIIGKLKKIELKLGDISKDIFQGFLSGRDRIYFVSLIGDGKEVVKVINLSDKKEYVVEKKLLKKVLKGKEIRRWKIDWKNLYMVYPYVINDGTSSLVSIDELKKQYPHIYQYLLHYKKDLMSSETSEAVDETNWYRFRRARSPEQFENPKLITQVLASKNSFTFDEKDGFYFVGGGNAGGFGITLNDNFSSDYYFVLSLLNSKLLEFYLKHISTPFRGGYYSYGKRFIEKFPIVVPSDKEKFKLTELAKRQLENSKKLREFGDKKTSETVKLEEEIKRTDAEIDEIIFKLYGITEKEKKTIEESLK